MTSPGNLRRRSSGNKKLSITIDRHQSKIQSVSGFSVSSTIQKYRHDTVRRRAAIKADAPERLENRPSRTVVTEAFIEPRCPDADRHDVEKSEAAIRTLQG